MAGRGRPNPRRANGSRRDAVRRAVASRGDPCWICGGAIDWGLPRGDPRAGQVDEIVPVSRGGSPTDPANCVGTHACCNGWRKAKPTGQVDAVRRLVAQRFGGWSGPTDFVAKAKAVAKGGRTMPGAAPEPTTDW